MINYYRLSKKELSFLSSIQKPIMDNQNNRLSQPVVAVVIKPNSKLSMIWTLKWYKHNVKQNKIDTELYTYNLYAMF